MDARQHALAYTRFVRGVSESLLRDFPESEAGRRIHPTHVPPVWVVGHIAATDGYFGGIMGATGIQIPEKYNSLFAGGSKNPVPDAKDCPPLSEVVGVMRSARDTLLAWFEAASPAALAVDLKEKSGGFVDNPLDALLKAGWHEGWHFGQLASTRKALGLPNVLG